MLFCSIIVPVSAEGGISVSDWEEFAAVLEEMQNTGGNVFLTEDITVPASASLTYISGRSRKETVIDTCGHTIFVEGSLDLWPYLKVVHDNSEDELFHVLPGGELNLVSVCLETAEGGTAILQEEGSFLTWGDLEGEGIPAFSCSGRIVTPDTVTAAAQWYYDCVRLPVVRIPADEDFSADLLPESVSASTVCGHQMNEEEIPVIWDESQFPEKHERTLITGCFPDGYSVYEGAVPKCLVVWESDLEPFFLNAYMETGDGGTEIVYLYGETVHGGTVRLETSEDGTVWTEASGTDGYEPAEAGDGESLFWMLIYSDDPDSVQRQKYYRMQLTLPDGTETCSEALELRGSLIFEMGDVEGGRGGETSPGEGELQLPENTDPGSSGQEQQEEENDLLPEDHDTEAQSSPSSSGSDDPLPEEHDAEVEISSLSGSDSGSVQEYSSDLQTEESGGYHPPASEGMTNKYLAADPSAENGILSDDGNRSQADNASEESISWQKTAGVLSLAAVIAGAVFFSVYRIRK